jgi:O-antigen/teichoic acid export membrane protein
MRHPLRLRFARNVAMTGGAQATQAVMAMIAGIVVARELGASAKGTISVLTALGAMSVLVCSLGVHLSGIYFLGRHKAERDTIVSNNLLFASVGGVVTASGLLAIGVLFEQEVLHNIDLGLFLLYVTCVPLLYFNEFGRALLLGLGRVGTYNVPDALGGVLLLVGTVVAILLFGHDLTPQVALRVVLELALTVMIVAFLRRATRIRFRPSLAMIRRQLSYGLRNYASSLLWQFLLQSDILLCNHFLGSGPTGVYSVAVSLGLPITMLGGVVGTLTFQRVSAEEDRDARIAQTNTAVRVLIPLVLGVIAAVGLVAQVAIPVLYGDAFSDAGIALALLLPGLFAYSLEIVLMNFLAGEGSPPIVVYGPFVGLVVNVVANLYVIPRWGINGASVTSSVGYASVLLLVVRYYRRSTGAGLREMLLARGADFRLLMRGRAPAEVPSA